MLDRLWTERFAREWAANWNSKNLDAILSHYAPEVTFRSPRISVVLGKRQTFVSGLAELRTYWSKALAQVKELHFSITSIGIGGDALTILYMNHRGDHVCETLVFGQDGKIVEGIVTYLSPLHQQMPR
jgi:ketosteroid isomerase-like protein